MRETLTRVPSLQLRTHAEFPHPRSHFAVDASTAKSDWSALDQTNWITPKPRCSIVLTVVGIAAGLVRREDAELVALRVGQHHPAAFAVA